MEAVSNTLKLDSSFLSRNYRIYLELSEPNGFKYHQTLIVIFISFVQLLMAHLHTYVLRFVGPDSFIDYLTTSFSYFDIYNLLRTSSFVYNIIFYVLCALAYFYLLTYTMLLLTPKANIKKSFWTTFFVYYCKYYSWMLFFPSVITLSARLLCPSHIMKTIEDSSLVCKGNIMESDPLISVLAGSGLIICVGMVGINGFFAYSTWYNKTDYFSTHYERFIPYFNLTRLIGTLLMVVPTEEKTYMLGYLTVHLGLGGFLLYLLLKYFPFSKIKVLKMFLFFILSYLGQSIGMLIDYLTLGTLYNNQTNSLLFMFVSFLALELGFFYFLEHHIMSYIKEKESTKGDFLEMIKKIRILHYVSGSFTPSYVIYFKGLLTLHFETCRNPSCFCKAEKVFDAKKGRELEVSKKSAMKGVFAKYLIRNWFEEHIAFDKKDPRPSIFYADFLFNKLKNVHMALTQLALAERKAFGFNEKRKILQHKEQITAFIREKNEEFRKGNLAFEIVVFLEEQLDKLLHLKRRFLKRSVKFWQILENPFLNLTELNGELSKLMSIKSELAILWSPLTPYLDSKKQLKFYYQWYLKTILNKKLKVADEEIKTLESFDEEDVMSIGSKELFSENKHKDKLIYQPDCCVLHVKSAANALAGIWKVNSGVKEVFDYNKSEIIGSEIARLMSPFFARLHPGFVGNFIKSSRSHALYNTKYAFGLNKSGFIFPLWLVLKQFVDPLGNLEYISMIKPLKSKKSQSDYIILDQYGIIDGVSKGITKNLLLEPELIKKMKINILLISPKLIRFFTYEKYLKKDDESLSEKKKKKDKRAQKRKEFEKAKKTMKDKAEKEKTLKSPNGVRSEDRKIPQIKKTWMLASGNKELEVNETLAESPKHEKQFSSRKSIIKKTFISKLYL